MERDMASIDCHNFTDIRRRPLVIGKLDQVRLPFVVTMPQLAVGAVVFALLFLTRAAWGSIMSDRLHILVFVGLPILAAQQISRTTIEGRPLSKAVAGLFRLWTSPRHGTVNGRRRQAPTATDLRVRPLVDQHAPRQRTRPGASRRAADSAGGRNPSRNGESR